MGFWSSLDPFSSKSVWRKAGRAIDPAYSKGAVGRYTHDIARPAIATIKVGTGVTAIEWAGGKVARAVGAKGVARYLDRDVKRTIPEAGKGYAIGGGVGLAVLGGQKIGAAVADAARNAVGGGGAASSSATPPATIPDVTTATSSSGGLRALLRLAFPGVIE